MWIMTQNKMGLVNTDNVSDIFINIKRHCLVASIGTSKDEPFLGIGDYNNNDECLDVLRDIFENLSIKQVVYIMPPREKSIQ